MAFYPDTFLRDAEQFDCIEGIALPEFRTLVIERQRAKHKKSKLYAALF